jgi:type IV pilus assembly protein PilY1
MQRRLALLVGLTLLALPVPGAQADDDQIFGANVKPNIMLFLDSSGSMDWVIPNGGSGAAYNPSTQYPVPGSGSEYYRYCSYRDSRGRTVQTSCDTTTGDNADIYDLKGARVTTSIPNVPDSRARTALRTYGRYDGIVSGWGYTYHLRTGNYLNYMFSQQNARKKIDIAKDVLTRLINGLEGVRIGLAIFRNNNANFGSGGNARILAQIITVDDDTDRATLTNLVNNITPEGSTPLGAALRDLGKYFAGTLSNPSGGTYPTPVESEVAQCQPNYIISISDGQPNDGLYSWNNPTPGADPHDHDGNPTGAPVVSPWVATNLKSQNPPVTGVLIHTIGFSIPENEATVTNATLQQIATNGGGNFYSADSEALLEQALEDAILRIMQATFCFASPVVPTTSANGIDRAYLASFQSDPSSPFWQGHLKAYQRTDGIVPVNNDPTSADYRKPLESAKLWDAGRQLELATAASRTIYTYVNGSLQQFATATTDVTAAALGVPLGERDALIGLIRGEGRSWKLGDIFHSTPVLVTRPFLPSTDPSYVQFRVDNASRTAILLAGANDGMLHAFRESDGAELWAFIPPNLLPKLKALRSNADGHQFFVDGSPVAADVKIRRGSETTPAWRTIVIFGERRGGNAYYCLDITDPEHPEYLWEFTDAEIAETWSDPVVGKVKMASAASRPEDTAYVAIVGGGYTPGGDNSAGRGIFAIDVATGAKFWEYKTNRTDSHVPVCPNPYPTTSGYPADEKECLNFSIPSNPLAVDLNNDGFIDHVYIGDIAGQLWKFKMKDPATLSGGTTGTVTNWSGRRLFATRNSQSNPPPEGVQWNPDQAIYYAPTAAFDKSGNLWLFFGTGDRNHPNADTSAHLARFYGIKDRDPDDTTNGRLPVIQTHLADVTSGNASDSDGWFFRLPGDDEKVLAQSEVFNEIVFFNTFTPDSGNQAQCGGSGIAKQYSVQMLTGYGAIESWDSSGHVNLYPTGNISNTRARVIGHGIPSRPMVIITESGATISTSVIQATTSQELPANPVPPPAGMRKILFWREVF